jgi:hypothetical protein
MRRARREHGETQAGAAQEAVSQCARSSCSARRPLDERRGERELFFRTWQQTVRLVVITAIAVGAA